MKTLTLYINHLYQSELGFESYQKLENVSIKSKVYNHETFSGGLYKEIVFEDVIFDNCTFFGTNIDNSLFINCLFINCKFQFSKFSDCNFELTSWENCTWGLTALKDSEIIHSESKNNYSFESNGAFSNTESLGLAEFLSLSA